MAGYNILTGANHWYLHTHYSAVYYAIYVALETWVNATLFRGDPSRTFLASPSYDFRRRFELLDPSKQWEDVNAASLQFPFASYWPLASGWQLDTEKVTAFQALEGVTDKAAEVRAIPSHIEIPLNAYFDREDDARVAFDILYYNSAFMKKIITSVAYKGQILQIPMNFTITGLSFNSAGSTENDWLKSQRIFIISVVFDIHSFVLEPPQQPPYEEKISGYEEWGGDPSQDPLYITEWAESYLKAGSKEDHIVHVSWQDLLDPVETIEINSINFNVGGNSDESTIDENSATLYWDVNANSGLSKIFIRINDYPEIEIDPSKANHYKFSNLEEGTQYSGYITFLDNANASKRFFFHFTTKLSEATIANKKSDPASLVGVTW